MAELVELLCGRLASKCGEVVGIFADDLIEILVYRAWVRCEFGGDRTRKRDGLGTALK